MVDLSTEQLRQYLDRCIQLALEARKDPEMRYPYIGAMLVSGNGRIISTGRKRLADRLRNFSVHAEHEAIDNGILDVDQDTVLLTTLEPCIAKDYRRKS